MKINQQLGVECDGVKLRNGIVRAQVVDLNADRTLNCFGDLSTAEREVTQGQSRCNALRSQREKKAINSP